METIQIPASWDAMKRAYAASDENRLAVATRLHEAGLVGTQEDQDALWHQCDTLLALLHFEVTNPADLIEKLEIVLDGFGDDDKKSLGRVIVDVRRISAIHATMRDEWEANLAHYRTVRAASDALVLGTPGEDDAIDAYCVAMDALIAVPAPDSEAIALKIALMKQRDAIDIDDWLDVLATDVERLGRGTFLGRATDQHGGWLAERNALAAKLNSREIPVGDFDAAASRVHALEAMIFDTAAASPAGVFAKAALSLILNEEGSHLVAESAANILAEARHFEMIPHALDRDPRNFPL